MVERSLDEEAVSLEHTSGWGGGAHGRGTAYSIGVAVRVRPMVHQETSKNCQSIARCMDEKVVCLLDPSKVMGEDDYLRRDRSRERHFAFDYAFDETASQEHVYRRTTRKLLSGVIDGYNASCFAYGATGAGKTFTMLGDQKRPGIMVQTVAELFQRISQIKDKNYRVYLSYLEVYNENIKDLLTPTGTYLELREDALRGICVAGITEFATTSAGETMDLLHRGNLNRAVEPTKKNETSSRSHAVLQIMVEQQDRTADVSAVVKVGKLSLIDLAGSERASHTENRGRRLLEGANINRSLLALANCINALAAASSSRNHRAAAFVPYRDSKLTRLLKDSFGGNTRTVMIANISPAHDQFEETLNSLKYANRAKNIKTRIQQNVKGVHYHISEYKRIIGELRAEVKELKHNLARLEEDKGTVLPPIETASALADVASSPARSPSKRKEKDEATRLSRRIAEMFGDRTQLMTRLVALEEELWTLGLNKAGKEAEADQSLDDSAGEHARGELQRLQHSFEEKTAAKWAVEQRLQEQVDQATQLQTLASQRLHSRRLDHINLLMRNGALQLANHELQLRSAARVRYMEAVMREMSRHPGLQVDLTQVETQPVASELPGLLAPLRKSTPSALQGEAVADSTVLFSKSRRGRSSRDGAGSLMDGLELGDVDGTDGGEGHTEADKPVVITRDVTTPRHGRRRGGGGGGGGSGGPRESHDGGWSGGGRRPVSSRPHRGAAGDNGAASDTETVRRTDRTDARRAGGQRGGGRLMSPRGPSGGYASIHMSPSPSRNTPSLIAAENHGGGNKPTQHHRRGGQNAVGGARRDRFADPDKGGDKGNRGNNQHARLLRAYGGDHPSYAHNNRNNRNRAKPQRPGIFPPLQSPT